MLEKRQKYTLLFLILLVFFTVYRLLFIANGPFNLTEDEAHYWEWSRNLDLSYYSKGPMVAYVIFIFTSIFGNTEFGVRFGAVAISASISLMTYFIIRDMFDERKAFYSVILMNIIPLFAAGAIIFTIDPPFFFFWCMAIFFTYKAINCGKRWWYAIGIAVGMGLLTKYTMAFFIPLLFAFLLLSRANNHWVTKKEPYLAVIIGLLFFIPIIFWNLQHDWVSFRHVAGQAGLSDERAWSLRVAVKNFVEFIGIQIVIITPVIFAGMVYAGYRSVRGFIMERRGAPCFRMEGSSPRNAFQNPISGDDYLFLIIFSMPVFLFFLIYSLYSKVQGNWAATAYFTSTIATVAVFDEIYKRKKNGLLKIAIISAIIIAFLVTIIGHNIDGFKKIGIPIKPDPTARLKGWNELGDEIGKINKGMQKHTFIFSNRYQISSELAFYVDGQPKVYCVNLDRRLNQYDFWEGFDSLTGWDAIYVKGYGNVANDPEIDNAFSSCEKAKAFIAFDDGYKQKTFSIFRCYNFKGMEIKRDKVTY
ncbi:MAG: glycosyltransferase family 39 protein [Nitrospirae bacterium]|nr:glycosyltransferase family 39 protein [Nitrospirota bacterium]